MARYLKGSIGNTWDRYQDRDEAPVRSIELVPESDEVLICRFARAQAMYQLERRPEMLAYLKTLAAQLNERGIAERVA